MLHYVLGRAVQSLLALLILLVIVFSMSRLTGDPTDLFLPLSATAEVRKQFAEEQERWKLFAGAVGHTLRARS